MRPGFRRGIRFQQKESEPAREGHRTLTSALWLGRRSDFLVTEAVHRQETVVHFQAKGRQGGGDNPTTRSGMT